MLSAAAGMAAMGSSPRLEAAQANGSGDRSRIRAVAFDGFAIFDPRPVAKRVEEMFPGKGTQVTELWRNRQFEYTWLRTAGGQYKDFWQVTEDALQFAVKSQGLPLENDRRDALMNTYRMLPPWPDVGDTLGELHRLGIRMAFLTNFTAAMLDENLTAAKLKQYFEPHLTTDRVKAFKPSPRAYQMGPDAFGLRREEIAFAAFGAWDAVGARWFGYPTVWVNRMHVAEEELDMHPDSIVADLSGLASFVRNGPRI
jgi:2-haloacid dehalogenase